MARSVRFRLARQRKDALARKLNALAPEADDRLKVAALKGATEVIETAKGFAPVEEGDLRESGGARLDPGTASVRAIAGFSAPHAHLAEFGTAERQHRTGKSTGSAPAQPFLFPAYRILKRRVIGRMTRAVNASIKAVAKR